jgi:hypothetical protein
VKLPVDALIAPDKLTRYLLVKRLVGDKSDFLKQAGYALDAWQRLEQDIRQQVLPMEALLIEKAVYGDYYEIRAPLAGPNGTVLNVRTIWMQESASGITKFITLYPDRRTAR